MKATDDSLPFMSFSVSNWVATTIGLTLEEYAILHKLACAAWLRNGKLPHEPTGVARLVGLSAQELVRIWPAIEPWFEKAPDGLSLSMPELEAERLRAIELRDKRRRGAVKTNREYWGRIPAGMTEPQSGPDSDSHSASLSEPDSGSHSESLTTRTHTSPHTSPPTSPSPHTHTRLEESEEPLNSTKAKPSDTRPPSPRRTIPRPS